MFSLSLPLLSSFLSPILFCQNVQRDFYRTVLGGFAYVSYSPILLRIGLMHAAILWQWNHILLLAKRLPMEPIGGQSITGAAYIFPSPRVDPSMRWGEVDCLRGHRQHLRPLATTITISCPPSVPSLHPTLFHIVYQSWSEKKKSHEGSPWFLKRKKKDAFFGSDAILCPASFFRPTLLRMENGKNEWVGGRHVGGGCLHPVPLGGWVDVWERAFSVVALNNVLLRYVCLKLTLLFFSSSRWCLLYSLRLLR